MGRFVASCRDFVLVGRVPGMIDDATDEHP
jgi:hypothetical protein